MILLIEDDPMVAQVLSELLEGRGLSVHLVESGTAAVGALHELDPDLIVLDLILPDTDGLVLLPRLRALVQAPIIVCSARTQQVDRVLAFKLGADDFVTKPVDLEELEARVTAVLRRAQRVQHASTDELRVGELVIVPARASVTFDGQPVQLTPTEYRLLVALAGCPGAVLSRAMLAHSVWGYQDPGTDHLVEVHLGRLRTKLRRVRAGPLLLTVRGSGYTLATDAREPDDPSAGCP